MYSTKHTPATVTITMTSGQYDIFVAAINQAKANDLAIANWTGDSVTDIEARYQLPHDSIINDMIDAYAAQQTGIPMF